MAALLHDPADSVLVLVDLQQNMMAAIEDGDAVLARARYLARCARLLGVPVLATEQIPSKLGPTAAPIAELLAEGSLFAKASFSCTRSLDFMDALRGTWRKQVVLAGVEAHICVLQTALDLRAQGFDVTVAEDATGSRNAARKRAGLQRALSGGCQTAHTESIVYEWLGDANHEKFREVLQATKEAPL